MFLARTGDRVQEKVGQRVARRCLWRLLKNASLLTRSALARCSTSVAKAASRSLSLLAFRIRTCCPCSCASAAYEEVLQDVAALGPVASAATSSAGGRRGAPRVRNWGGISIANSTPPDARLVWKALDIRFVMNYGFCQSTFPQGRSMNPQVKIKPDDTRVRIMDTAEALFRRLGFAKTAVADIAAELKMSPANVYRFFPSKNAIVEAICQRCLGEVEDRAWAVARSPGSAAERIERLVLEIVGFHKENNLTDQRVNDIVLAAIELSWGAIRAHKEHMRMVLEAILRDGLERGEFEALDPRETSRLMLIALVHFCHPVLVAQYLQDQGDLEADARATVRFLLRAVTPGAEPCRPTAPPIPKHVQNVTIERFRQSSHLRDRRHEPWRSRSALAPFVRLPLSPRCSFSPAAKPIRRRRPPPSVRCRSNASASRMRIARGNSWAWCGRATRPISASVSPARSSCASSMSAIVSRSATWWRASIPRI